MPMTPRLLQRYDQDLVPALGKRLGRSNRLSLPRLEKIVINMGVGAAVQEKKHLEEATDALALISGQKPIVLRARKSVAGFRLRLGMAIACKVTLRGARMYEFLDRLISLALPRVRDFRGLNPRSFDGHGNYSLGIADQSIFPEIDTSKITYSQGMNITFVTSATNDSDARALLTRVGMPFRGTREQGN